MFMLYIIWNNKEMIVNNKSHDTDKILCDKKVGVK